MDQVGADCTCSYWEFMPLQLRHEQHTASHTSHLHLRGSFGCTLCASIGPTHHGDPRDSPNTTQSKNP
eukprot:6064035-Amphidinium_carterae.1